MFDASCERPVRVVVVDDHAVLRLGLVNLISPSASLGVVGEAASGERAIALAHELRPDVILMDLRMPGIGGLEAAKRIHSRLPDIRIIAVTAWEREPMSRLHRNGFVACIGKSIDLPTLETVIERAMAQQRATRRRLTADDTGHQPATVSPFDRLSSREMQVCNLVVEGQKASEIASQMRISAKTVHSYRYRIFERLGISSDLELAKLAAAWGVFGA